MRLRERRCHRGGGPPVAGAPPKFASDRTAGVPREKILSLHFIYKRLDLLFFCTMECDGARVVALYLLSWMISGGMPSPRHPRRPNPPA
jgi:hypothetical protein